MSLINAVGDIGLEALIAKAEELRDDIEGFANRHVPVFLFAGESNASGVVPNAGLSSLELAPRTAIKILNDDHFETLDIPTNNVPALPNQHGWENGIADMMEWGTVIQSEIDSPGLVTGFLGHEVVYVVKTAIGSTHINEWFEGNPLNTDVFVPRIEAAKAAFAELGLVPVWYVFYSQGINDGIGGTSLASWKVDTIKYLAYMRSLLGAVPIFATRLMPLFEKYNVLIDQIAQEDKLFFTIPTNPSSGALQDIYHWNYAECKQIAKRMFLAAVEFGIGEDYASSQINAASKTNTGAQAAVADPGGDMENAIWNSFTAASQIGNDLVFTNAIPSGGVVVQKINPFDFKIIIKFPSLAEVLYVAIALRNNASPNYGWNSSRGDVSLIFVGNPAGITSGRIYITSNGSNLAFPIHYGPSVETFPVWFQMTREGDDLTYSRSYDGDTYEFLCRQVDALWGINDYLYLSAFLNVAAAGKKINIQVTKESQELVSNNVTWSSFTNASQVSHELLFGTSTPTGALDGVIDATGYFEVICRFVKQEVDGNCVVFLSDNNTAAYTWNTSAFRGGFYHTAGLIALSRGYTDTLMVAPSGFPVHIKMYKEGNDLVYAKSYDGIEFREIYRDEDRLEGVTTLYLKALCADLPVGKKITVKTGEYVSIMPELIVPEWFGLLNASQVGDKLAFGTSEPTGALAGEIDTKIPFEIITEYTNETENGAVVVFLDVDNAANFDWASGQNYAGGHFINAGLLTITEAFPTDLHTVAVTLPVQVKISKAGNDMVFSKSNNSGASWTEVYRIVNRLVLYPLMYLKALCADVPTGKTVKVKATLVQPPKPPVLKGAQFLKNLETTEPTDSVLNAKYGLYSALTVVSYPNITGGAMYFTKLDEGSSAIWDRKTVDSEI